MGLASARLRDVSDACKGLARQIEDSGHAPSFMVRAQMQIRRIREAIGFAGNSGEAISGRFDVDHLRTEARSLLLLCDQLDRERERDNG